MPGAADISKNAEDFAIVAYQGDRPVCYNHRKRREDRRGLPGGMVSLSWIALGSTLMAVLAVGLATLRRRSLLRNRQAATSLLHALRLGLEAKDGLTCKHSDRVAVYLVWFAEKVFGQLSESELRAFAFAGFLHDVGKLQVPGSILGKSDGLSAHDLAVLRQHPEWGASLISAVPALRRARSVILHHHERYDGTGYPMHLAGRRIPLEARMAAVVDTFDAMTATRPYRRYVSPERALEEIISHSGRQFDPNLVNIFVRQFHELRRIHAQFQQVSDAAVADGCTQGL